MLLLCLASLVYSMNMSFCCEDFKQFISPDCDRLSFICEWLENRGVKTVVMPIEGKNHVYVVFPQSCYNGMFKIKTVVAHYDRFEGSPGANDNSSSVWCLMNWAVQLNEADFSHNVRLIFTDGEELGNGGKDFSIGAQGAFALAGVFKRLGITDDDVFVFDCVGRGEIPVLQKSVLPLKTPAKMKKNFNSLYERTQKLLKAGGKNNWVILPVGYSDNAGFLANGICAVAVTFLPREEASKYMYDLALVKGLESYVTNHTVPDGKTMAEMEDLLPLSWRLLHTDGDNLDSLTEESFVIMERILSLISDMKTLGGV